MEKSSKGIGNKIKLLRLLIKLEAGWALISLIGLIVFIGFDCGKKINETLAMWLVIFFTLGLAVGYYLIFFHNKQLRTLQKKRAFNLGVNSEAIKASWWVGGS